MKSASRLKTAGDQTGGEAQRRHESYGHGGEPRRAARIRLSLARRHAEEEKQAHRIVGERREAEPLVNSNASFRSWVAMEWREIGYVGCTGRAAELLKRGFVAVCRIGGSSTVPARVRLVAAMSPCPHGECGEEEGFDRAQSSRWRAR